MTSINYETMKNICKNGKYYYPASKHYGNEDANVACDKCYKNNLNVSIGYENYDLCLLCVDDITKAKKIKLDYMDIKYYMMQSQFRSQ